jgi:hypothetical protein
MDVTLLAFDLTNGISGRFFWPKKNEDGKLSSADIYHLIERKEII